MKTRTEDLEKQVEEARNALFHVQFNTADLPKHVQIQLRDNLQELAFILKDVK